MKTQLQIQKNGSWTMALWLAVRLAVLLAFIVPAQVQAKTVKPPDVDYYTCTMHPSVRSQDPDGKCPICGMDLVPVMKKDAEANADTDKKKMELVEARNMADQAVYASRKAIADNKDKIPAELGAAIADKAAAVEALKTSEDMTALKTATEELSKELSKVYEAVQKAGGQSAPTDSTQTPPTEEPGTQSAPNDNPEQK